MTDRARFGDLLRLAAERLDAADRDAVRKVTSGAEVQDTTHALLSLITVISRLIAVSDANAPDAVGRRTRGQQAPAAIETGDLALWTGRLAFAAPDWTPASGPRHLHRPSSSLVASPDDLPRVVAAVHYACETLTTLARTSRAQIQAVARASRILVPTRTLPESVDIPRAFHRAPGPRVAGVLAHYMDAATASRQATAAISAVAEAVRAPSQVLTAARDTVRSVSQAFRRDPQAVASHSAPDENYHLPGPLENVLHQLRTTDQQLLERATVLDRDGARLIIEAAERLDGARQISALSALSRSMTAAPITNHALASSEIGTLSTSIRSAVGRELQREAGQ